VPWDRPLDIVCAPRVLDKRRQDNVIIVAPQAELARARRPSCREEGVQELAPLRSEYCR